MGIGWSNMGIECQNMGIVWQNMDIGWQNMVIEGQNMDIVKMGSGVHIWSIGHRMSKYGSIREEQEHQSLTTKILFERGKNDPAGNRTRDLLCQVDTYSTTEVASLKKRMFNIHIPIHE
ncbi:hypothetical protein M8J77_023135 [Diaphorina citri]|nr:hypothetical protein M8J77_023135 [Diaphorina citri]